MNKYKFHRKEPNEEFGWLIQGIQKEPPITQSTLFPTLQDQIFADMPDLIRSYKQKSTRIKNIAKHYKLDEKTAKKYYTATFDRFVHALEYEHYIKNKEWFDWIETPEFILYMDRMRQEIDQKLQRDQEEYEANLNTGKEHLIAVDIRDDGISKILDNPIFSDFHYYGPFRYLIEILGITEHDAKVLHAKGYLKLLKGKKSTLWDYNFLKYIPDKSLNTDHLQCCECGMYLDYNIVGFNEKLGIHSEEHYKCPDCLGVSKEYIAEIAQHYKSFGCTMFI